MRKSISHTPIGNQFPVLIRKILTRYESVFIELLHTKWMKTWIFCEKSPTFLRKSVTQTYHKRLIKKETSKHCFFYVIRDVEEEGFERFKGEDPAYLLKGNVA